MGSPTYGATESDYRPDRWKGFRDDYGFTGKEEDVEIGLQYFGKRYLSPYLGRWISPDPLAVHQPLEADLHLYAYVTGKVLRAIDPVGLDLAEFLNGLGAGAVAKVKEIGQAAVRPVTLVSEGKYAEAASDVGKKLALANPAVAVNVGAYELARKVIDVPAQVRAAVTAKDDFAAGKLALDPVLTSMEVAAAVDGIRAGRSKGAPAPSTQTLAKAQADIAQEMSRGSRPATVATARKDGVVIEGQSGTGQALHPKVQEMLDSVPAENQSMYHGQCAEMSCLSNIYSEGLDPSGAEMSTAKVRNSGNPDHGAAHEPCSSCSYVMDEAGVEYAGDSD